MEGMPVRFYRYRYQDYWEAELPVGWIVNEHGNLLLIAAKRPGGTDFTVWTSSKAVFEKSRSQEAQPDPAKDWPSVIAFYTMLNEDDEARNPSVDCGLWCEEFQFWIRNRSWRYRGEDFLIMITQSAKSDKVDAAKDAIVDRFVNTLSLVGK